MVSQGLLFSEPSIAETCVWCELTEGIDPGQWASLCRYIGILTHKEFTIVKKNILSKSDNIKNIPKGISHRCDDIVKIPLVSVGPSGIGGDYQREI
ncbi:MAG: hypothetical protein JW837_01305 [Sedimentisphaerales bacterium]|nr:hypothetical protein [Sedimentisphaerales bacterium]